MNRLGTRLEDITYNRLKEVAKQKDIPIVLDGKLRSKADIIEEMRDRYVRPLMLGTQFDSNEIEDLSLALQTRNYSNIESIIKNSPKAISKQKFYKASGGFRSGIGEECPYDLQEISRAADVEPYISISIRKHREQILKDGYHCDSSDVNIKRYIEKRIFELSLRSPFTFDDIIREAFTNLIKYHTAFIVIERDLYRSSGKQIKLYGKVLDPISAIYCIDPITMRPVLSSKGNRVIRWNHVSSEHSYSPDRKISSWPEYDVITITMDKKSGFLFGTPYILPVLDDIRALRRLEELVQIVSSKHAFPLYHWIVGTDEKPAKIYDDGSSELDLVLGQAESVGDSGAIVTNERSRIEVVGAKDAAIDLAPYLKYFEDRALGGLRLSQMDLGRGNSANKASAHTMSKSIEDASADYQRAFSQAVSWKLFLYLALEGGFAVDRENMPFLRFPPINAEEQRAKENHGTLLMQTNGITMSEYRRDYLGREPLTKEQENDVFFNKYEMPKIEQTEKIKAQTKNTTMPTNQNGTKKTKTRVTANNSSEKFQINSSYADNLKTYKTGLSILFDKQNVNWDQIGLSIMEECLNNISVSMVAHFYRGIKDCSGQLKKEKPYISNKYLVKILKIFTKDLLQSNINRCMVKINENLTNDKFYLQSLVDSLTESLKDTYILSMATAYRTGFIKTARIFNAANIKYVQGDNSFIHTFTQKTLPIKLIAASKKDLDCSLFVEQENEN